MYKAVKVRIYPDARQKAILRRHIGHSRFVFNAGLRRCIWEYHAAMEAGEKPKAPSHFRLTSWLTEFKRNPEVEFLNEVPVNVLSLSLERVARAYKNFFTLRNQGVGFPRQKGRHSPRTARYGRTVKIKDGRYVSLPPRELGWMRMRGWRPEFEAGRIKLATVEWAKSDKWYLSIMVDDGIEETETELPESPRILAVHCGLGDHVTVFDGQYCRKFPQDRLLTQADENLKRKDRKLSRKANAARGTGVYSKRREKARIQRARAHERVANARADRANKIAAFIGEHADVAVVEAWGIKGMMQAKEFSRDIADAGWHQLITKIGMKVPHVVKLEKYFPCSQICHVCGHQQDPPVPLSNLGWTCSGCGLRHDRNENAARNVYAAGLEAL